MKQKTILIFNFLLISLVGVSQPTVFFNCEFEIRFDQSISLEMNNISIVGICKRNNSENDLEIKFSNDTNDRNTFKIDTTRNTVSFNFIQTGTTKVDYFKVKIISIGSVIELKIPGLWREKIIINATKIRTGSFDLTNLKSKKLKVNDKRESCYIEIIGNKRE